MAADLRIKFNADISQLQNKLAGIGNMMRAAIGSAAVYGVASAIKSIAEFTGSIQDLAEETGMSTDAIQELNYAAIQAGTTIDGMQTAIRKLYDILGQTEATKEQVVLFQKLGIGFHQLKSMSPDAAFKAVAQAVGKIADPMERTAAATDLFGKSGIKIAAMGGSLDQFAKAAHNAGAVMSKETVASIALLDDAIESSKLKMKSWAGSAIGVYNSISAAAGKAAGEGRSAILAGAHKALNPETWGLTLPPLPKSNEQIADETIADMVAATEAHNKAVDAAEKDAAALAKVKREAEAKDRKAREDHNKRINDIAAKQAADEQRAGEEAVAKWKNKLDKRAEIDEALMRLREANADVIRNEEENLANAEENAIQKRIDAAQKFADKAADIMQAVNAKQAQMGIGDGGAAGLLAMAAESPAARRRRRRGIEEEEELRGKIQAMAEGRRVRLTAAEKKRIKELAVDEAEAKRVQNIAQARLDKLQQDMQRFRKEQDDKEMRRNIAATMNAQVKAEKHLQKLADNLRVAD
jgi:hypothetical protein